MTRTHFFIPVLAGGILSLTSCKEKPETPEELVKVTEETQNIVKESPAKEDTVVKSLTAAERAENLGFAQYLPKNTPLYTAIFNGKEAFTRLLATPIGGFIQERMAEEGMSFDEVMETSELKSMLSIYSEEYFVSYGEGSGEAVNSAIGLYEQVLYYLSKSGVWAANSYIRDGKNIQPESLFLPLEKGPLKGAPADLIQFLSQTKMPAVIQGSKASDLDTRNEVLAYYEQMISIFGLMGEAAEPITIKRGESEFSGFKVSGAKLAEMIGDEQKDKLKIFIKEGEIEGFIEALKGQSLSVATGVKDDYVILFYGASEDQLVFAESVEDSICIRDEFNDLDPYLTKDFISVGYSDESVTKDIKSVENLLVKLLNSLVNGAKDALGSAESFGDTSDVEALLGSLVDQGNAMSSMFSHIDRSSVLYMEDGLKLESFGGSNIPSIDFKPEHKLSSLAQGENTLLFANWTSNEDYNTKVKEYIETLVASKYLIAQRIAGLDIDSTKFAQFALGLGMFDQVAKEDLVSIWKATSEDMAAGLGSETAFIIDMNGTLPKLPNIPKAMIDNGKIPRLAYVSTVNDRDQLKVAWGKINTSLENILTTVGQARGQQIPMQEPMSSDKGGLTTWSFPIPFQNNNFMAALSVSDDLFVASTSKTFSESLSENYKKGGGEKRKGAWIHADLKTLHAYSDEMFNLTNDNLEEFFPTEFAREDFIANKPMIKDVLKQLSSVESFTSHIRLEGGKTRISAHLEVK